MWPDIEGTRNTRPALDRGEAPRMSSRLCPTLLPQDRRTTDSLVDDRTTAPIRVGLAAIRASANSALFTRHFGPRTKSRTRTPRPGNRALVQFGKIVSGTVCAIEQKMSIVVSDQIGRDLTRGFFDKSQSFF